MTRPKYFGTDGIRGTAGKPPMSVEFVLKLGYAAGRVLCENLHGPSTFVVGRDSRESGPMLQQALTAGLLASGVNVVDLGILTTPAIAYLTQKSGASGGAVISASHNPSKENGIKLLNSQGMKLSEADELQIEAVLQNENLFIQPEIPGFGRVLDGSKWHETYIQDLIASVPKLDLSDINLVLDCANGAAYDVAPEVFKRLGARLLTLNVDPDGTNINLQAGSEHVRSDPTAFADFVTGHHAHLGIAFDGDADRVILLDEKGGLIDGDHMLAILAEYLSGTGRLLGNTLVTTNMANGCLSKFLTENGIHLVETPVGDKYVTEELLRMTDTSGVGSMIGLGGEQSGHIILLDNEHRTGDGIRTVLFILETLRVLGIQKISALTRKITKFPQLIASCNVASKPDLETLKPLQDRVDSLTKNLPGLVRINLRYSGTEPKFRLMLETDTRHTPEEVAKIAWQICDLVQAETNTPPGAKIEVMNVSDGGLMKRPTEQTKKG